MSQSRQIAGCSESNTRYADRDCGKTLLSFALQAACPNSGHRQIKPGIPTRGIPGFMSKWRDYRASLARNLNRRCSRLERARRSFRLIRSPLFAYGDAPLGRRSARSPTALQAACPNPRLDMQNPGYPQGASGILCRSGGIRTRGLLVPNQTRYQTALHLEKKEPIKGLEPLT